MLVKIGQLEGLKYVGEGNYNNIIINRGLVSLYVKKNEKKTRIKNIVESLNILKYSIECGCLLTDKIMDIIITNGLLTVIKNYLNLAFYVLNF